MAAGFIVLLPIIVLGTAWTAGHVMTRGGL